MNSAIVHIIDDDEAMRDSLSFLLETAEYKSLTYDSAVTFLAALPTLAPGCIITDVRMPEMSGIELVRRLHEQGAAYPVIVITGHADVPLAVEAMKAGVVDFIEKPFDDEVLLLAVRQAMAREVDQQAEREARAEILARIESLSGRERDVLDGLVAGRGNKVIAFDLGISPRTIEIYRANLMTKMGASGLSDLVRMTLLAQR
jgi:two-component system response regulator FixJ